MTRTVNDSILNSPYCESERYWLFDTGEWCDAGFGGQGLRG